MTKAYEAAEFVKNLLSGATEVPDDKIYIARPHPIFVGEGPVILVYPLNAPRTVYMGASQAPQETKLDRGISFDVLVDSVYNDVRNPAAIAQASLIMDQCTEAVFGEPTQRISELAALDIQVRMYAPGDEIHYTVESRNEQMISMGSSLMLGVVEKWTKKSRKDIIPKHTGKIATEQSERELDFES